MRERAYFGGPICSHADPLFKAKNHPLNRKNWNWHGVIVNTDIQSEPRGQNLVGKDGFLLNAWQMTWNSVNL
jgi:hypothetical protein